MASISLDIQRMEENLELLVSDEQDAALVGLHNLVQVTSELVIELDNVRTRFTWNEIQDTMMKLEVALELATDELPYAELWDGDPDLF